MENKYISSNEIKLLNDLYIQYDNYDSIRGKVSDITELLNILELEKELYYKEVNYTSSELILSIEYRISLVNFLKELLTIDVKASLGYINKEKYIESIDELINIINNTDSKIALNSLSDWDIENVKSVLLKYVYDETNINYKKGTSDYNDEFARNLLKRLRHYQEMYVAYFYKTLFIDELINALVDIEKCIIYSYLNMDIIDLDKMI